MSLIFRKAGIAAAATLLLAGCASGSSLSQGGSGMTSGSRTPASSAGSAPSAGQAAAASDGLVVGTPTSASIERSVSAAYTLPAGAFLNAFDGVIAAAVRLGGYVVSSSTNPDGTGRIVSGTVTLKIPAAKIADFLNGMPTSFTASAIDFASVDHSADFVDVNARLASAHARIAALNNLLSKATSLSDITSLEQQIATVQTEIDTAQGQLNVLASSVDMSTANIGLSERGAALAQAPAPIPGGIGSGWNNALLATGAILEVMVTMLPLLIATLVVWVLWRLLSRGGLMRRAQPLDK